MTSVAGAAYGTAVLTLYVDLPDTPRRARPCDKAMARALFEQEVPLAVVESALLLGSLRRCVRPPGARPLGRIRSLAYFSPVIDELLRQPPPPGYLEYLRLKARQAFRLDVPQTAVSHSRLPR